MYVCICIHTCVWVNIHAYTWGNRGVDMHACLAYAHHLCVCECVCLRLCVYTYAYICTNKHAYIHTYTHTFQRNLVLMHGCLQGREPPGSGTWCVCTCIDSLRYSNAHKHHLMYALMPTAILLNTRVCIRCWGPIAWALLLKPQVLKRRHYFGEKKKGRSECVHARVCLSVYMYQGHSHGRGHFVFTQTGMTSPNSELHWPRLHARLVSCLSEQYLIYLLFIWLY